MIISRPIYRRLHRMAIRRRVFRIGTRTPTFAQLIGCQLTSECWIKYLSTIIIFCWVACIPTLYQISVRDTRISAHLAPIVMWSRTLCGSLNHIIFEFFRQFSFCLRQFRIWNASVAPAPAPGGQRSKQYKAKRQPTHSLNQSPSQAWRTLFLKRRSESACVFSA